VEKGMCIARPEVRCPYYAGGVPPICGVCKHYETIEVVTGGLVFEDEHGNWSTTGCLFDMSVVCILDKSEFITLTSCSMCKLGGFRKLNDMLKGRDEI